MHAGDWKGNPRERSLPEDLALGGIILKWVFKICDW
jgi:hypothetical protein